MRARSSGGVLIAVHELGGSGPTVLCCHATGFHGMVWRPLAERLAGRARVVSFDFRFHGDSTAPSRSSLHWRDFAADVLAVVDQLGLTSPYVVGHSKGGAAALLAERARPGTFSGMYLFEPILFPPLPAPPPGAANPLAEGAERRRERFDSRADARRHFAARPPLSALHPDALEAYVAHGFADADGGGVRLKCRGADEAQVYRTGAGHDTWAHLGDVGCPVTVACGATTTSVGPAAVAAIAARLPAGSAEVLDGMGHFGPLEDPDRVAAAVAAALPAPPAEVQDGRPTS